VGMFGKSKGEKALEATASVATAIAVVGGVAMLAWLDASSAVQAEESRRAERSDRLARASRAVEYWTRQAEHNWAIGNRAAFELASRELDRAKREYRAV
jgi:hypothetical protein